MDDERIIELTDEETGESQNFMYMVTLERGDKQYAVLEPADAGEDDEETEVVIMEVIENGEDEYTFQSLEDEALLEELFNEYMEMLENDDEDEDDEEDDEDDDK